MGAFPYKLYCISLNEELEVVLGRRTIACWKIFGFICFTQKNLSVEVMLRKKAILQVAVTSSNFNFYHVRGPLSVEAVDLHVSGSKLSSRRSHWRGSNISVSGGRRPVK